MPPKKWRNLSIREETFALVKGHMEGWKKRASVAGFIDEAVREKLDRIRAEGATS